MRHLRVNVTEQGRVVRRAHVAVGKVERAREEGGQDTGSLRRAGVESEAQVGNSRQAGQEICQSFRPGESLVTRQGTSGPFLCVAISTSGTTGSALQIDPGDNQPAERIRPDREVGVVEEASDPRRVPLTLQQPGRIRERAPVWNMRDTCLVHLG